MTQAVSDDASFVGRYGETHEDSAPEVSRNEFVEIGFGEIELDAQKDGAIRGNGERSRMEARFRHDGIEFNAATLA